MRGLSVQLPVSMCLTKPQLLFLLILIFMVQGCDKNTMGGEPRASRQPPENVSLNEAVMMTVTPTADGGAYITGLDAGVWYARATEATKVEFEGGEPDWFSPEVIPMVDGSAYVTSMTDSSIWHLQGAQAHRVEETSVTPEDAENVESPEFALYVYEREKRKNLQRMLDEERYGADEY